MEPAGTCFISNTFKSKLPQFEDYEPLVRGKMITLMSIGHNKEYLCLCNMGLISIEHKYVLMCVPFVKKEGYLHPTDKTIIDLVAFGQGLMAAVPDKNPMKQLEWIYQNYPEYWKREQTGEFYPNGANAVYKEMIQK